MPNKEPGYCLTKVLEPKITVSPVNGGGLFRAYVQKSSLVQLLNVWKYDVEIRRHVVECDSVKLINYITSDREKTKINIKISLKENKTIR